MQNKRRVGTIYETRVADWLKQNGYRILERNFRCGFGEIDLIAKKEKYIIFIEVKYRGKNSCGAPQESVTFWKQQRISDAASCYLYRHRYAPDTPCRFDVVAVTDQRIELIENAFFYCGNIK